MAFFSGCDSNQYVLQVVVIGQYTFNVLTEEQKRDYDLMLEARQEASKKIAVHLKNNDGTYVPLKLRDPDNPSADPVEKQEYITLYWAKFNGASGDLNLSSPGKKTLRVSFKGAVGECEYTVVDPNDKS